MRKLLLGLLFLIVPGVLHAQVYPQPANVGLAANRPTFCASTGQLYYATDTTTLYYSTVAGTSCTWSTIGGGGGSGTVSGQANGVIPLATGSTTIGAQSALSDNGTTVTSTEPMTAPGYNANGSGAGWLSYGQGADNCVAKQAANSDCEEANATIATAFHRVRAGAAYAGLPYWSLSGVAMTESAATSAQILAACTNCNVWSSLANPAGNLALSMGTNTSIFSGTAATNQFFAWKNTTPAVVGTSQGSPVNALCGRAFHGSADVEDCTTESELPGNGNDAAINFSFGHTGTSTGNWNLVLPGTPNINTSGGGAITLGGNTSSVNFMTGGSLRMASGLISVYGGTNTVRHGVPSQVVNSDLTGQTAAITATTLLSSLGFAYRVCWSADITTASDGTSTLGGANGFQVIYTSPADSVVKTTVANATLTSTANTTGTALGDCAMVYAKASTNIQFTFGYTNVSTVTAMAYELHITVEFL